MTNNCLKWKIISEVLWWYGTKRFIPGLFSVGLLMGIYWRIDLNFNKQNELNNFTLTISAVTWIFKIRHQTHSSCWPTKRSDGPAPLKYLISTSFLISIYLSFKRKNRALWLKNSYIRSDNTLCVSSCHYVRGMFSHLDACWFINTNKSVWYSLSGSCLLSFPIRLSFPLATSARVISVRDFWFRGNNTAPSKT